MFTVNKNQELFCHLGKTSECMTAAKICIFMYILAPETGYATGYGNQYTKVERSEAKQGERNDLKELPSESDGGEPREQAVKAWQEIEARQANQYTKVPRSNLRQSKPIHKAVKAWQEIETPKGGRGKTRSDSDRVFPREQAVKAWQEIETFQFGRFSRSSESDRRKPREQAVKLTGRFYINFNH